MYELEQENRIEQIEMEMEECSDKEEIKRKRSRKQACKSRIHQRKREEVHKKHLDVILEFFPTSSRTKIAKLFDDATVLDEDFKQLCKL